MPYTTTVTFLAHDGGSIPPATARLWEVFSTAGAAPQQIEWDRTVVAAPGSSFTISFARGPGGSLPTRDIALSIQDTSRVTGEEGWWFRSGRMTTLPAEPVEVVKMGPHVVTQADLTIALAGPVGGPAPFPLTVDANTTMTTATMGLLSTGDIVLQASGTTMVLGSPIAFTYTLTFELLASRDVAAGAAEMLEIGTANKGSISFAGGGLVGAALAALLNAVNGAVLRDLFPVWRLAIEKALNAATLTKLAGLITEGATSIPPGVVVSARIVRKSGNGIEVFPALGAFGGVFSKFPPAASGKCAIATACAGAASREVTALRVYRDTILTTNVPGRMVVELYQRVSPPVAWCIRHNRAVRSLMRFTVVRPAYSFALRRISAAQKQKPTAPGG